jgi:hypothetical protein
VYSVCLVLAVDGAAAEGRGLAAAAPPQADAAAQGLPRYERDCPERSRGFVGDAAWDGDLAGGEEEVERAVRVLEEGADALARQLRGLDVEEVSVIRAGGTTVVSSSKATTKDRSKEEAAPTEEQAGILAEISAIDTSLPISASGPASPASSAASSSRAPLDPPLSPSSLRIVGLLGVALLLSSLRSRPSTPAAQREHRLLVDSEACGALLVAAYHQFGAHQFGAPGDEATEASERDAPGTARSDSAASESTLASSDFSLSTEATPASSSLLSMDSKAAKPAGPRSGPSSGGEVAGLGLEKEAPNKVNVFDAFQSLQAPPANPPPPRPREPARVPQSSLHASLLAGLALSLLRSRDLAQLGARRAAALRDYLADEPPERWSFRCPKGEAPLAGGRAPGEALGDPRCALFW